MDIEGVDVSHRVACHWTEQIERGEILPHEVTPVFVPPQPGDPAAVDVDPDAYINQGYGIDPF